MNQKQVIKSFTYRPEIDGLRAISVIAVVLYHAKLGFTGGFVGVDVFFVISGYLITALIIRDLERRNFSMLDFWERRVRRILPAAIVMVAVVLVSGWVLLLPSDFAKLGASGFAQALFSANIYYWQTTSYFEGPSEEVPLLHTWSLAVEEQFYLFVPLMLIILFKFGLRSRSILIAVFALLIGSSLVLSITFLPSSPAATFYLLPTRAWEMAIGSMVALFAPAIFVRVKSIWRFVFSIVGLLLILGPVFLYTSDMAFPGIAALPPCSGAALCILFLRSSNHSTDSGIAERSLFRLLSSRIMVSVGLISYSLYLWHWPLFAFTRYWTFGPLEFEVRIILVLVSFLLAYLSWRFVETPFRIRTIGESRPAVFAYTCGGMGGCALLGICVFIFQGIPQRFPPAVVAVDKMRIKEKNEYPVPMMSFERARSGMIPVYVDSEDAATKIFVWGDSHSRVILPAIEKVFDGIDYHMEVTWYPSTPPILDYIPSARFALRDQAPQYNEMICEYILQNEFDHVVLVGKWSEHLPVSNSGSDQEVQIINSLAETVRRLSSAGVQPWIVLQVPRYSVNIPKVFIARGHFSQDIGNYLIPVEGGDFFNERLISHWKVMEDAGAGLIDPSQELIGNDGKFLIGSRVMAYYFDNNHLSHAGAEAVAEAFVPMIQFVEAKQNIVQNESER